MRRVGWRPGDVGLDGGAFSPVAAGGGGPVYVGVQRGAESVLHAVGLDGRVLWRAPLGEFGGPVRVAPDGGIWLANRTALRETRPDGSPGRRVEPAAEADEHLGAFLALADGLVLAWWTEPFRGARVERVDRDGRRRWSTPLDVPTLQYAGISQLRRETGWRPEPLPPWVPRDFRALAWDGLVASGDRLLASYLEISSGIGIGYCLDIATGRIAWRTPPHPPGERVALGDGGFLVGTRGYGAFATWRYDRDGDRLDHWPSEGAPLVSSRGRIRVLERTNETSGPARMRRLHRDGSVTAGPELTGSDTAGPVLSADGRAAFWRDGRLWTVDGQLAPRVHHRDPGRSARGRMLLFDNGTLAFVSTRGDAPAALTLVPTDLPGMDRGPWPCDGGTLGANPLP